MKTLKKSRFLQRSLWIMLLLIAWEAAAKSGKISPLILPDIESVAAELAAALLYGNLWLQTLYSLGIIAAGMALSALLAAVLSLLSMRFAAADSFIDTLLSIAHPLPGLAVMPLIILWFGINTGSVIAVVIHSALWPILLNMRTGLRSVPRIYTDIGRNLSMRSYAVTLQILFPASFGYILSGVKIAWARAWRAFIGLEMVFGAVGNTGGIGWYIFKERTFMNTPGLYAGILVVVAIGMIVEDLLFAAVEKNTTQKWGADKKIH